MLLTETKLRQIVKEEYAKLMKEDDISKEQEAMNYINKTFNNPQIKKMSAETLKKAYTLEVKKAAKLISSITFLEKFHNKIPVNVYNAIYNTLKGREKISPLEQEPQHPSIGGTPTDYGV